MTSLPYYRLWILLAAVVIAVGLLMLGAWETSYKVFEEIPEDENDPFLVTEIIIPNIQIHCPCMDLIRYLSWSPKDSALFRIHALIV